MEKTICVYGIMFYEIHKIYSDNLGATEIGGAAYIRISSDQKNYREWN